MSSFSTPAIMLRRVNYGDFDLIVTFLTLTKGKISVIAKSAKKSTKRFSGILELFSLLELVCRSPHRKGLPVLEEAVLKQPFGGIRTDVLKMAYASYWAEIINTWMEDNQRDDRLYHLLVYVLGALDASRISAAVLSILFQMRFLNLAGLSPQLAGCRICNRDMERVGGELLTVDLSQGGIVCDRCPDGISKQIRLSKGTVKQLCWIESGNLTKASRIRFSDAAVKEGLEFLEAFVPFHLGRKPRSLTFLQQMRR